MGNGGAYDKYELYGRMDQMHHDIVAELRNLSSQVRHLNQQVSGLNRGIQNMNETIEMQNDALNKIEDSVSAVEANSSSIAELERIRMEQEKRYMDYQTFVTRQNRMDEGHLW